MHKMLKEEPKKKTISYISGIDMKEHTIEVSPTKIEIIEALHNFSKTLGYDVFEQIIPINDNGDLRFVICTIERTNENRDKLELGAGKYLITISEPYK